MTESTPGIVEEAEVLDQSALEEASPETAPGKEKIGKIAGRTTLAAALIVAGAAALPEKAEAEGVYFGTDGSMFVDNGANTVYMNSGGIYTQPTVILNGVPNYIAPTINIPVHVPVVIPTPMHVPTSTYTVIDTSFDSYTLEERLQAQIDRHQIKISRLRAAMARAKIAKRARINAEIEVHVAALLRLREEARSVQSPESLDARIIDASYDKTSAPTPSGYERVCTETEYVKQYFADGRIVMTPTGRETPCD